jgi:hypothetical protein
MRILENPYLLKDLNEDLDPFLLELTEWDPPDLLKDKSMPELSMLFEGASRTEDNPQMMTMMTMEAMDLLEEEDLPMKSPMVTCKIMSPSPQPSKSELWDPYPGSLMEIKLRPRPSSPNSSAT